MQLVWNAYYLTTRDVVEAVAGYNYYIEWFLLMCLHIYNPS